MRMTNTREQFAAEHTELFVADTSYRDVKPGRFQSLPVYY